MNAILKTVGVSAALALLLSVLSQTRAEEPKTPPSPDELLKKLEEAGKPGPEHKKLQPFVGHWTFTMKMWTDPNQPPAEMKGTIDRKWIMDGRFIQETARGECAKSGKSFEFMGLLGYDAGQKKFSCVKVCGLCGTAACNMMTADPSGNRFESTKEETCPVTGQKFKGRDEVIIQNNDRIVANFYKTMNDREVKIGEMIATRQK